MREKEVFTQNNLTMSDIQAIDMEPENGRPDIYWMDTSFIRELKQTIDMR